jgi:hypothetical protein
MHQIRLQPGGHKVHSVSQCLLRRQLTSLLVSRRNRNAALASGENAGLLLAPSRASSGSVVHVLALACNLKFIVQIQSAVVCCACCCGALDM